ncbi:DUF1206 domain-containing protein [Verrucomicrobiota bacterium sgz303538]
MPDQHDVATWAVTLGRFGLAARGLVYLVLGLLAAKAGFLGGGKVTDQRGAMQQIGESPFGDVLLWVVALALIGYIVWRITAAVLDLEHYGSDAKGMVKRVGVLLSGLAYAGVSTTALALAAGRPAKGGEQQAQDRTAWLMSQPFGKWLVGIVGLIILGIAIFQFYQAISCKFCERLGSGLTGEQQTWSRRAGRLGYAARGIAFLLIGWFFLQAAVHSDPSQAGGLALALQTLARQPYGPWLLGLVGSGLGLFGLFSFIEARYRRIG